MHHKSKENVEKLLDDLCTILLSDQGNPRFGECLLNFSLLRCRKTMAGQAASKSAMKAWISWATSQPNRQDLANKHYERVKKSGHVSLAIRCIHYEFLGEAVERWTGQRLKDPAPSIQAPLDFVAPNGTPIM